jgi:transposase
VPAGDDRELPTGDTITTKRCEVACGSKRSGTEVKLPRFRGHPTVWVFGLHNGKAAPYAPEFRRQMIELVRAGRTPEELAKECEPSAQAICN